MNTCKLTEHIPKRMLLQWHITERCNLRCTHCYQEETCCPEPSRDELTAAYEQLKAFLQQCRKDNKNKRFRAHITVTGGEPFMREDFLDLLEIMSSDAAVLSFAVLTNGTLLTPALVRRLALLKPDFVQVSIDGTRDSHDGIRGCGSYDRAVGGLRMLVRENIPAHISFTADAANFRDFPDVANLGKRLGVTRVWSDRMIPCGRGGSDPDRTMTPDETREFFLLMKGAQGRGWFSPPVVALRRSLQFMVSGDRPYRCTAGDTLVTVLPNGDVCPCRRMPLVAGNIFRDPLEDIYKSSGLFMRLRNRDLVSRGCEGCFYSRTCGGGSRCLANAIYGDPFRADPGCWLAMKTKEFTTEDTEKNRFRFVQGPVNSTVVNN